MRQQVSLYIAVVATIVAIVAVVMLYKERMPVETPPINPDGTREGFAGLGVSFKVKADREFVDNQGYFYTIPPNLQGALSPRMSGTASYGPWLNTKMPARNMQGVPINPLTYQNTIKKCDNGVNVYNQNGQGMKMKAAGSCGPANGCGSREGFDTVPPNFMSTNNAQVVNQLPPRANMVVNDMLPEMSDEASASIAQPIVYDRYIYANQRSRLYGLGDPIRGDLPIVPYNGDWFRPSVQPNIDLRDGAMMVLGGQDNATARNTMALMREASGNSMGTFAGAPVMATQTNIGYGAGGADVLATAFP